jgi:hypothetical protein
MAITYTNIFPCKTLQKFAQIGIFGSKINHLATLAERLKTKKVNQLAVHVRLTGRQL